MLKSFDVELNRLAEGLISSEKKFCFASLASLRRLKTCLAGESRKEFSSRKGAKHAKVEEIIERKTL